MKLQLDKKLVDVIKGNVVGVLYRDLDSVPARLIPFKIETAKELGLEDADIIDFMDIDTIEVFVHNNRYALASNEIYTMENLLDVPFEKENDKIVLWGRVFEPYHLVSFISNLEEANYGEDNIF